MMKIIILFMLLALSEKFVTADSTISGTAVTVMLGSPKWFQNRFTIMINQVIVSLPHDWLVQIYYNPSKKMSQEAVSYPGIQKHITNGKIKLVAIPEEMRKKLRKRNLLLSPYFWENIPSERVLLFGGNSVLCANSPYTIDDFRGYDMVSGRGVAGLSLRSKSAVLSLINSKGGVDFASSVTGAEEEVFLTHLNRVAPKEVSDKFGVAPDGSGPARPFSISGVMAGLNVTLRTQYIEYCPEIKMLFPTLHSDKCFGAEPSPLDCFRFLCQYGGLKCDRQGGAQEIEWSQSLKRKTARMKLRLIST